MYSNKDIKKSQTDILNILEIINFEKIVNDYVQKELARLGFVSLLPMKDSHRWSASDSSNTSKNLQKVENDDPMDIDLVILKNTKDLACVEGKINDSIIQVLLDLCANVSFMPEEIYKEFDLKIDTSKKHKLIGASTNYTSLGIVKNVLITLAPNCIIEEDFVIIGNYPYREIKLNRTCLRCYNYNLHKFRNYIALTYNGKNFFIPIVPDKNRCN